MHNIIIDEQFRDLLPPLDAITYELLEANLIQNGCRDALILWGDILIDGHNRYEICTRHGIEFKTMQKEFESREKVIVWIISTQVSRRNMTPIQLSYYRGMHYNMEKKMIKNREGINQHSEVKGQNVPKPQSPSTAGVLAKQYKVNEKTIKRDAKVADAISAIGASSPEARRKILSGEMQISKKELEGMSSGTGEETQIIAEQIEEGTYEKKKQAASGPAKGSKPAASIQCGIQPLHAFVDHIKKNILSGLLRIRSNGDIPQLKMELRACIDSLEDLYRKIES